jgi:hypothetical protein
MLGATVEALCIIGDRRLEHEAVALSDCMELAALRT